MENFLCVPIHLDVLFLPIPRTVVEAHVDFSKLPYTAKDKHGSLLDFNADTPYLSEEIAAKPLKNEGLYLQAGIHLHWALPHALTRALQNKDGLQWPAVPNRWLVTRKYKKDIKTQWVVESDYLHPIGITPPPASINFLIETTNETSQPFRYMGRQLLVEKWLNENSQSEYLGKLTAVGYGDPNFAALYPNCYSVFGFHDDQYTKDDDLKDLSYEVVGWYANPNDDFVNPNDPSKSFWLEYAYQSTYIKHGGEDKSITGVTLGNELNNDSKCEAFNDEFNWQIEKTSVGIFPERSLYYASLNWLSELTPADNQRDIQVTVGNTDTEALSAYLASKLFPDNKNEKNKAEDQIEALLFENDGKKHKLDWGFKFREARHEKGFISFNGGTVWSVRTNALPTPKTVSNPDHNTPVTNQEKKQISLPPKLGHLLNALNQQQKKLDSTTNEVEDLRNLLYADWCKYQRCAYPPEENRTAYPLADEVHYFIEHYDKPLLLHKIALITLLNEQCNQSELALKNELEYLNSQITEKNKNAVVPQPTYTLQKAPSQCYWRANDPVLLISGPGIRPSSRHGENKTLICKILQTELPAQTPEFIASLGKVFEGEEPSIWSRQPWNPYLLEWEVQLLPVEAGSNLTGKNHDYDAKYVGENFELPIDRVDLHPITTGTKVVNAANFYSGRSILTPHASQNITTTLKSWLRKQNIEAAKAWLETDIKPIHSKDLDKIYSDAYTNIRAWLDSWGSKSVDWEITDITTWLDSQNKSWQAEQVSNPYANLRDRLNNFTDPAYPNILSIYQNLQKREETYLAQSLGGFHEALLMQQPTYRLPLKDPLAFDHYKEFAKEVEKLLGNGKRIGPQLSNDFNPIRTGIMRLVNLRIVGTFGQTRTLIKDGNVQVIATETLTAPENALSKNTVYLPPRLAQPARLDFYWLDADNDEVELNRHPATTPICGWVLPNNLDNTLLVYHQNGNILGWIEQVDGVTVWQSAPGASGPVYTDVISDSHLQKVVLHILNCSKNEAGYLENFLNALNLALENIHPDNSAQHEALALLMGRPIAVARASLKLELKGLPAIDHDWNRFRQDLQRASATSPRTTNNFANVQFPIRLGDYRQLNDGLVGYWVEKGQSFEENIFYSPQSQKNASKTIRTHDDGKMNRHLTLADEPEIYTVLLDPLGVIHAHCGLLPMQTLSIPADQYQAALKTMEVFFMIAPILAPDGKPTLPLPIEPGFKWSWLSRQNGAEWQTTTNVEKPNPQANFPVQQQILEGWLKLGTDDEKPS